MILALENIRVGYDKNRLVLDDIGFCLNTGNILAILGANGAGKTTLLRCINGLLKPWRGVARVEGASIMHMRTREMARRLGYVAQNNGTGRVTVFDAVLLGRKPHLRWGPNGTDLSKVGGVLDQLDLAPLSLRRLDQLSGGELQKVCIARALAQEPSVLLLDEPTSNLDLKNRLEILIMLRRIVREHKMAAVMTLHDINLGLRFADRLVFLKQGRVFADLTPEEVKPATVTEVYGVTVDVVRHKGQIIVVPAAAEKQVCQAD